ncbi:MAG TPA: VOC family protein, partial [Alphaproteobacteria bacterium]|nr:VOC family protein [Alphaproteobacteria bacterium]
AFYEGVMGFRVAVDERINIAEGGSVRHVFFDIGRDQLLAFMEARDVAGVPAQYAASINEGLGVPASFYHFAFEAGSPAALATRRDALRAAGVAVTEIVDHGWARSVYFRDPNGVSLEYACVVRDLTEEDAKLREITLPRAALGIDRSGQDAVS